MRKRKSFIGIDCLYTIPNKCSNCSTFFIEGENFTVDATRSITICGECVESGKYDYNSEWEYGVYGRMKTLIGVYHRPTFDQFMKGKACKLDK